MNLLYGITFAKFGDDICRVKVAVVGLYDRPAKRRLPLHRFVEDTRDYLRTHGEPIL